MLRDTYDGWALVTGASSGIGREFAKYLAKEGFPLVIVARSESALQVLAHELSNRYNVEVCSLVADLSDALQTQALIQKIKEQNKKIGLLVNNAGFGRFDKFDASDPDDYQSMITLNCITPVLLSRAFLEDMKKASRGAIIFLSSIGAFVPGPGAAVYSATKSFNLVLGEALWQELKFSGVDVLSVCPGYTETEFFSSAGVSDISAPSRRSPEDVVLTAFKALGKSPSKVDGKINSMMAFLLTRLLPRKAVLWLVDRIT